MSRFRIMIALVGAAALWCAAPLAVTHAAAARAGSLAWGKAIEVPGLKALNVGADSQVLSVSCAAVSHCSAGGYYTDGSGHSQAFVAKQYGGWRTAIEVPGTATLNAGGDAQVLSVSCASTGDCMAGGYYTDGSAHFQAFVVSQRNGGWGTAIEVPGMGALNVGGDSQVLSVSCASVGNCTAGGYYSDRRPGHFQAFVASQRNGGWGTAIKVPGIGALNVGGDAQVSSVSCASAGNCAVGGFYYDGFDRVRAFVASERNGRWAKAIEVPGTGALKVGGNGQVASVSCASAGNCVAGGDYTDRPGHGLAFVASQRNGRWGTAIEVPGTGALDAGRGARGAAVRSVSCASAGNCTVGGSYDDGSRRSQVFVASERNGRWGTAIELPGTGALNAGGFAQASSVSCGSAGNCSVGGYYADRHGRRQAFVASQRNGRWGNAIKVYGTGALNSDRGAAINSVSCVPTGNCAAGGYFWSQSGINLQGLVVSRF